MPPTTPQPYIATEGNLTLGHGHQVWTVPGVGVKSIARLGDVNITFHSPDQIRAVIAYLAVLLAEHEAEIARGGDDEDDEDDAEHDQWLRAEIQYEHGMAAD